jgi:ABC-2 type transport system permease protein
MRNFWLIAKHEYLHTVARRAFIIITAAIPLGLAAIVALGILVGSMGEDTRPIGYVDYSGKLDPTLHDALPDAEDRVQVRAFADEAAARASLDNQELQAFFIIPADYPANLHTDLYYLEKPPGGDAWRDFDDFVRINLLADVQPGIRQRLYEGPDITVHDIASNREFSESSIINVILPFVATFVFFFSTMAAAGYMLGVVAGEKENRTIEIMVTSVTPGQLIGGKTAGLLAAALTQFAIYILAAVIGIWAAAPHVPELQQAVVPWGYLGLMALFFLPTYALIATVMIAIGGAVAELQQGQQLAGLVNILFMAPIFLTPVLFQDPGHPLMVLLTFFPTTSFMTISLRWGLGSVPLWQVGVGWVLLVISTLAMVWVAARIFRVGMLRYGQPLKLRTALAAIRER